MSNKITKDNMDFILKELAKEYPERLNENNVQAILDRQPESSGLSLNVEMEDFSMKANEEEPDYTYKKPRGPRM